VKIIINSLKAISTYLNKFLSEIINSILKKLYTKESYYIENIIRKIMILLSNKNILIYPKS